MSEPAHEDPDWRNVPSDVKNQMDELRAKIDALDERIVDLLNNRAECALGMGRLKERVGLETYQPGREIQVLEHARQANHGPLEAGAITRLFERIIDENRRLERVTQRKD